MDLTERTRIIQYVDGAYFETLVKRNELVQGRLVEISDADKIVFLYKKNWIHHLSNRLTQGVLSKSGMEPEEYHASLAYDAEGKYRIRLGNLDSAANLLISVNGQYLSPHQPEAHLENGDLLQIGPDLLMQYQSSLVS